MGRPPKPVEQQRRPGRNLADKASVRLPLSGRKGITPPWPLDRANARENELWRRLWKTPQATMWEQLGWREVVARYARLLALAEKRDAKPIVLMESRQLEDRLGLSPMSMLRLRWAIEQPEVEMKSKKVVDIRDRLKAVE